MTEPKALKRTQKSNRISLRRNLESAGLAALGLAFATAAIATASRGADLCAVGWLGFIGLGWFVGAFDLRRQAREVRRLGLEVRHMQRKQLYDVSVRVNPAGSVRVTRVVAVLRCVARVSYADSYTVDDHEVFTITEHLFDGSSRLGHGEKLEKSAALQLPASLNVPVAKDEQPSLRTTLKIITEVDGATFFEHDEEAVKLDLPVTYQVTLSQM